MNEIKNKNNLITNIQNFVSNNLKIIIFSIFFLIILIISFQIYNYFTLQSLKKNSIKFFNSIELDENIFVNLNEIKKTDNFYSILSNLKIIQINNENNKYNISNDLYKEIILSNKLEDLYRSLIAIHASFTLIDAIYINNNLDYLEDINFYIKNIDDEIENFYSIRIIFLGRDLIYI